MSMSGRLENATYCVESVEMPALNNSGGTYLLYVVYDGIVAHNNLGVLEVEWRQKKFRVTSLT